MALVSKVRRKTSQNILCPEQRSVRLSRRSIVINAWGAFGLQPSSVRRAAAILRLEVAASLTNQCLDRERVNVRACSIEPAQSGSARLNSTAPRNMQLFCQALRATEPSGSRTGAPLPNRYRGSAAVDRPLAVADERSWTMSP